MKRQFILVKNIIIFVIFCDVGGGGHNKISEFLNRKFVLHVTNDFSLFEEYILHLKNFTIV